MKFSLTFFFSSLLLFMVSCSSIPNQNKNNSNINLAIKTSNKNKELIIESLFESNIEFTVNFDDYTGDVDGDMKKIREFYAEKKGLRAENT